MKLRKKNGDEWITGSDNVLSSRWYHVTAAWSSRDGLCLYINGDVIDQDISPRRREPRDLSSAYSDFLIGRAQDNTDADHAVSGVMLVDELYFWSVFKTETEMRELGEK